MNHPVTQNPNRYSLVVFVSADNIHVKGSPGPRIKHRLSLKIGWVERAYSDGTMFTDLTLHHFSFVMPNCL